MWNVLEQTIKTYLSNISLVLFSSISFIIAFLIPIFAPFPTFDDAGSVLLRTASIYLNLNPFNTAIIVVATLFSLLFLSFAMVAVNIVVKHSRTQTKVRADVIHAIEQYTGRVFIILLMATLVVWLVNVFTFNTGYSGLITAVAALLITPFVFYAPASIVIDDNKTMRAIRASLKFFFKRIDYFLIWLIFAIVIITAFDFVFITLTGTVISRYAMLIFSSIFIMPFLVLMQGELYMSRFKLLKN